MIGPIDIRANAAHPNFPLSTLYTFAGSPSAPRIFGVPGKIGNWSITAVNAVVSYPDNTTQTVALTHDANANCWIGVLPACSATGNVDGGFQVTASGTDAAGNPVTGYCLGVGDVRVLDRDTAVVADGVRYLLHYCEDEPETPQKGDVSYVSGELKWWNGTAWISFYDGAAAVASVNGLTGDVVLTGASIAVSGTDETKVDDALAGKRDKDDLAVYEDGIAPWTMITGGSPRIYKWNQDEGEWRCDEDGTKLWRDGALWHFMEYNAEYDIWEDLVPGLEAAPDALRLEFEFGRVFTRPVVEGVHPTSDNLARTSQFVGKADKYPFVAATTDYGAITLQDAKVQTYVVPSGSTTLTIAAPTGTSTTVRDMVLVIDCSALTEGGEPVVTWLAMFHPRTDAETDFACAAGVRNVYYISEYAPGEFAVAGWQVTEGGGTSEGGAS